MPSIKLIFFIFQILSKKLNVLGIEASVEMFIKAGYMQRIPQREKDALYIYAVLKTNSKTFGHVYMPFRYLKIAGDFEKMNYHIYGVSNIASLIFRYICFFVQYLLINCNTNNWTSPS